MQYIDEAKLIKDPEILELIKKKLMPDDVLRAVEIINRDGMPYTANFMIGFPDEKDEDVYKTMQLITDMKPEWIAAASVVPYPETEMYDKNPNLVDKAKLWPYCNWSPFDPKFLCNEKGDRYFGPSAEAIKSFYSLIQKINDHEPTPGTFSTISRDPESVTNNSVLSDQL